MGRDLLTTTRWKLSRITLTVIFFFAIAISSSRVAAAAADDDHQDHNHRLIRTRSSSEESDVLLVQHDRERLLKKEKKKEKAVVVASHGHDHDDAPFEIPRNQNKKKYKKIKRSYQDLDGPTALAFDSKNRPYMFESRGPQHFGYILTLRGGDDDGKKKWHKLDYRKDLQKAYPNVVLPNQRWPHAGGSITIDNHDRIYAIVSNGHNDWFFLFSADLGKTFQVIQMPGKSFLEIYTGHNDLDVPPAIGCITHRKNHLARWTSYHNLNVYFPTISSSTAKGKMVELGKPIHVSSDCSGVANHSGGFSFAITRTDGMTYVVYVEIPPKGTYKCNKGNCMAVGDNPGNPTYMSTIDRKTLKVVDKRHITNALPHKIDVHATPVITADSTGNIHVLSGGHSSRFMYRHSLDPQKINGRWTKPVHQNNDQQSYASLVADSDNRLHCIYRYQSVLRYIYKESPDSETWSEPRDIVIQPKHHQDYPKNKSGYPVIEFYYRFFIDKADTLYLSFSFWEVRTKDAGNYPRLLAMSKDKGKTWHLAMTADMAAASSVATDSSEKKKKSLSSPHS